MGAKHIYGKSPALSLISLLAKFRRLVCVLRMHFCLACNIFNVKDEHLISVRLGWITVDESINLGYRLLS